MATYLDRTFTAGNRRTLTFSAWIKFTGNLGTYNHLITTTPNPGNWDTIRIESDRSLGVRIGANVYVVNTNRLFRDTSGWYNIVVAIDTTESVAADRVKIYINGVQETSFATETYPTLNFDTDFNHSGETCRLFDNTWATGTEYFLGLVSHWHYIDGTAYPASTFGSTNATTGEWIITPTPSVTYGTNGFWMFKDDGSLNDDSGEGNNFTSSGTGMTNTQDCPSDIFAIVNPLASLPNTGVSTFSHGSTTCQGVNASYVNGGSSLQMTKGKFYCEVKYVATSSGSRAIIGITQDVSEISRINQDEGSYNTFYRSSGGERNVEGSSSSYGDSYTTGDIISIAFDLDNMKLYFAKNGVWQDSGDPESGASGTGAVSGMTAVASSFSGGYFFHSGSDSNAQNNTMSWNFGNGYFGTTAISSAGTNASNIGNFEYDVPAGYTALSTKGLQE